MKGKLYIAGLMLVLSAVIVSCCGPPTDQPTDIPTDTQTGETVEAPEAVKNVLGAVLAYLTANYSEAAPAPDLDWTAESTLPDPPPPGWMEYQCTPVNGAESWVVTVGYAVLPPEWTIYQVTVVNQAAGFEWKGEVDAAGQVAELLAPDEVRNARAVALAYIAQNYGEGIVPDYGVVCVEGRITPEGLVGSETYEFTSGDWVITISYPVVAPENVVYQVVVVNETAGFHWEGEVDAAGQVTETLAPSDVEPVVQPPEPGRALNAALAYMREHYGEQAPSSDLTWVGDHPPAEEPVGVQTFEFTPEGGAEDWVIAVSYPVVAPEDVVYQVVVTNETTGFQWEGEVDAAGQVTETLAPISEQLALCWYGRVESTPGDTAGLPVVGWLGHIVGDARYGDYLVLQPEGAGEVGLAGADTEIESTIMALRDTRGVGEYVHVWGTLTCGVDDYNGCQIVVTRLGYGRMVSDPDPVEGWEGTLTSGTFNDGRVNVFVLAGDFPVGYGIDSLDPTLAAQLAGLRDTGTTVRVWGQVTCGVLTAYGAEIQVTRLEIVGEPPAPSPTASPAPTPTPTPTPTEVVEEPVDGWVGTIVQLPPGSQYGEYFERDDGQRYGIEGANDTLRQQIEEYRWTGAQVQVWGQLHTNVPAPGGRSIQAERIEAISGPAEEARSLTTFATTSASSHLPTDHGGQYQSWMAMDGSLETSWVEGVAGPGVGEWIQLSFPGMIEIYYINLDVGYDRDEDIFYANNRIKRATIIFSNGEQIELTLSDRRGMQMIALARAPGPNIETTFVKVIIEEVYPGSRHNDTCLAEIEVWGIIQ